MYLTGKNALINESNRKFKHETTMKKQSYFLFTILLITFLLSCNNEKKERDGYKSLDFSYHDVVPADFPKLMIKGFNFPEDSTTIKTWVQRSNQDSIYLHGWGLWTGLTSLTDQKVPGYKEPLRVFETWLTPEEMVNEIKNGSKDYKSDTRSNRANLKKPHQLTHFSSTIETVNDSIHESAAYSPAASKFAIDNKIFMATTLYDYAKNKNRKEIPFFPNNAISIKPVFKLLQTSGGKTSFNMAAWNGTTDKLIPFPEKDWESFVTVDIQNKVKKSGSQYHLNDFIHYRFNKEDAHFFNTEFTEKEKNKLDAKPGDIALLVGMHVATREVTNWTWQTFWWDANSNNPPAPSSKAIADMRPDKLKGAARNYAMAVAYYMVNPNEPYVGDTIYGKPNYAFNPYLEAGFGPEVFNDSLSFVSTSSTDKVPTYVGVRTNCISCHRMATVNPETILTTMNKHKTSITPYVGNSFVSKTDSLFQKQLLLDFLWSIQGNIDTTGVKKYLDSYRNTK